MTTQEQAAPAAAKGRGARAMVLAITGVLAIGGAIVFGVLFWMNQRHTDVWVSGMTDGEQGLSVTLAHEPLSTEGSRYLFATDLSWDELVAEFEAVYPDGAETSDGDWAVAIDGTVYVLTELAEPEGYVVEAQFVLLGDTESGGVNVPMPASALEPDVIAEGEPVDAGWDLERWGEFYDLLGIAGDAGEFTVPTSDGGDALVTVDSAGIAVVERR